MLDHHVLRLLAGCDTPRTSERAGGFSVGPDQMALDVAIPRDKFVALHTPDVGMDRALDVAH